jgi:hypothetical protein
MGNITVHQEAEIDVLAIHNSTLYNTATVKVQKRLKENLNFRFIERR